MRLYIIIIIQYISQTGYTIIWASLLYQKLVSDAEERSCLNFQIKFSDLFKIKEVEGS